MRTHYSYVIMSSFVRGFNHFVSLLIHVRFVLRENRVFKFQNVYAMVLACLNSVNFRIFLACCSLQAPWLESERLMMLDRTLLLCLVACWSIAPICSMPCVVELNSSLLEISTMRELEVKPRPSRFFALGLAAAAGHLPQLALALGL